MDVWSSVWPAVDVQERVKVQGRCVWTSVQLLINLFSLKMFLMNSDREKELKWLKSFSLETGTKKHLRILLYGPSGSGKSSLINSVDSVCQNRITSPAPVSGGVDNFTVTVRWQIIILKIPELVVL